MNVVIDMGNSSAKIGCFTEDAVHGTYRRVTYDELLPIVKALQPRHVLFSSVVGDTEMWKTAFEKLTDSVWMLTPEVSLPFQNLYQTPQTLGTDRLASVAGAQVLYPGCTCLIIDAGTCIKYELLEKGMYYQGGSISPGVRMRFQAMHSFTERLPLVEPVAQTTLIGKNTHEAMQSGVMNGLLAEIEGIIYQYKKKYDPLNVILSGGDAHFFERRLKSPIFAVSELVLIGLNSILISMVQPANVPKNRRE